ncbi:unnamed protein product, partial [Prorocentrum cordatum]
PLWLGGVRGAGLLGLAAQLALGRQEGPLLLRIRTALQGALDARCETAATMVVLLNEDEDERLLKKGPDLFQELLRVYPVAEPEDYFKAGQWRDEVMKTDLQLIEAHRLEAGAPDPPALDEVKMPELPTAQPAGAGVRPPVTGLSALMGARATVAGGAPALAAPGSGVVELRLMALFVAKWKLDATKTKLALAKLPSE